MSCYIYEEQGNVLSSKRNELDDEYIKIFNVYIMRIKKYILIR